MAANRFGIDVGQLYRDKENIQSARTRNKLASLQLSEAEREVAQRPIKEQQAQEKNKILTGYNFQIQVVIVLIFVFNLSGLQFFVYFT